MGGFFLGGFLLGGAFLARNSRCRGGEFAKIFGIILERIEKPGVRSLKLFPQGFAPSPAQSPLAGLFFVLPDFSFSQ
ncbi:MAG: hypothetical protein EKK40_02825 [Bradyrhizobiaceae bacterium]|nr:MAG: hypothetical protein EKK40_02825 [Bradyrhizobiaceae bacterium]